MTMAELPSEQPDPWIGRVVHNRYAIRRFIGRGGMGVVYEAEHVVIGRKVALKMLAGRAAFGASNLERFRREARAAAAVGNAHIVDVLDMGELEDGTQYIALEYLEGADLGFVVASHPPFALSRAVDIVCQLCDALAAVHAASIVHRDLKPENVFLIERDGVRDFVKVLDFGVCKFHEPTAPRVTLTGDTVGTPQFMAPEQVECRSDIDHRTDIYALGGILYFLLAGVPPFCANSLPKIYMKICSEPAPSLLGSRPDLPASIDAVLQRALSKNRAERFASCHELKAALLAVADEVDELGATISQPSSFLPSQRHAHHTLVSATPESAPEMPTQLHATPGTGARPRRARARQVAIALLTLAAAGVVYVQASTASSASKQVGLTISPSRAAETSRSSMAPAVLAEPSVGGIQVDVGEPVRPRDSSPPAPRPSQRPPAKASAPAAQAGAATDPALRTNLDSSPTVDAEAGPEPTPKLDSAADALHQPPAPASPKAPAGSKAYELSTRPLIDGF